MDIILSFLGAWVIVGVAAMIVYFKIVPDGVTIEELGGGFTLVIVVLFLASLPALFIVQLALDLGGVEWRER